MWARCWTPSTASPHRALSSTPRWSASCWAATGCREHEIDPVCEDKVRATRQDDGSWTWTSETPGRPRP